MFTNLPQTTIEQLLSEGQLAPAMISNYLQTFPTFEIFSLKLSLHQFHKPACK